MSISNLIKHAAVQAVTGIVFGTMLDTVFPDIAQELDAGQSLDSTRGMTMLGASTLAQLTANAYLFTAGDNVLNSSIILGGQDPSGGIVFMLSMMWVQPKLEMKVGLIGNWLYQTALANFMPTPRGTNDNSRSTNAPGNGALFSGGALPSTHAVHTLNNALNTY
jgi:hypothetical protein